MKMHEHILEVSDKYEGILLDAYGVFWGGNAVGLFPGVTSTLKELKARGKIIGVLSNSTQLSTLMMKKVGLQGMQKDHHYDFCITSGDIAKDVFTKDELPFETHQKKYFLLHSHNPQYSSPYDLFDNSPFQEAKKIEDADFIYLSIPHIQGKDQTNPELFRQIVQEVVQHQLPMVCANPDRFAHEGYPPQAVVRQGTIAGFYEQHGGKVVYFGKPAHVSFAKAMDQFNQLGLHDPSKILMVGDTPETDIRGAKNFGMSSALIIETGIMQDRKNYILSDQETPQYYLRKLSAHDV